MKDTGRMPKHNKEIEIHYVCEERQGSQCEDCHQTLDDKSLLFVITKCAARGSFSLSQNRLAGSTSREPGFQTAGRVLIIKTVNKYT